MAASAFTVAPLLWNKCTFLPSRCQVVTTVLNNTSSGGFCGNDGIVHMALPGLPFGGVGKCVSDNVNEVVIIRRKALDMDLIMVPCHLPLPSRCQWDG